MGFAEARDESVAHAAMSTARRTAEITTASIDELVVA
jgi:hypothetical protein